LVDWRRQSFHQGTRFSYGFFQRHQGADMVDSRTGLADVPELVHMEDSRAQTIGIPGAYDYGCQRISWLDNVVTNWMGDDGFIKISTVR